MDKCDILFLQNNTLFNKNLLPKSSNRYESIDTRSSQKWKRLNIGGFIGAGIMGMLGMAGCAFADEAEHGLTAPSYPWANDGWFASYDHASLVSLLYLRHLLS